MEIKFEFENSYEGKLTVAGQEMQVVIRPGLTRLNGLPEGDERGNQVCFGGIVALELYSKLADVMQAEAIAAEEMGGFDIWEELPEEICDAIDRRIS